MTDGFLTLNRAVAFGSGLLYWAGVFVLARRIRRRIGRSPNVKPRGTRERVLWAGWFAVVAIWLAQPWLAGGAGAWPLLRLNQNLLWWPVSSVGIGLVVVGYAATLWCYSAMGDTWRMGINRKEKNRLVSCGPYRLVRHPIYLFQIVMLAGIALLLPTLASVIALAIHVVCVWIKAADEEAYLLSVHGEEYGEYLRRTGRLLPSFRRQVPR